MNRVRTFWNRPIALLLSVCMFILIFGAVRWSFGAELESLIKEGAFIIVLLWIGLLKLKYPVLDNLFEKGLKFYFKGTFILILAVAPVAAVLSAVKWALVSGPKYTNIGLLPCLNVVVFKARHRNLHALA